ncbi:hypothetical protein [Chondrinema litorale]|uniref:hypothetical protein n=1 Tax=Chondrinema litorale TaxID=2994555 RepID=UPI0025431453|nr:hypothetical protein [Chondrinema litorale]UZS00030.1 hypothetical protein OQ292_39300 [Chondrinema litorale]
MISTTNYMNFLVVEMLIEKIFNVTIVPKDLNQFGVLVSTLPILILNFYLFYYKKKYLEIVEQYEKLNTVKNAKWNAIGYMVCSFLLLGGVKYMLFFI